MVRCHISGIKADELVDLLFVKLMSYNYVILQQNCKYKYNEVKPIQSTLRLHLKSTLSNKKTAK